MAEITKRTGRCACGAVTFTAQAPCNYGACHCQMCRRWNGGPGLAVNCGTAVEIEGDVRIWNSSEWAERGFCAACGSALFYRLKGTGEHFMMLGAFDDQTGWEMTEQIFHDLKPDHLDFANKTKTLTEAETLALFAGGGQPE